MRATANAGGTWGAARQVAGNQVESISCPAPGDCVAASEQIASTASAHVYVATETNGVWNDGVALRGSGIIDFSNDGPETLPTSISCGAVGYCSLVGEYQGSTNSYSFVANSVRGIWGSAERIPGTGTLGIGDPPVVSCTGPGDCSAAGSYQDGSAVKADNKGMAAWGSYKHHEAGFEFVWATESVKLLSKSKCSEAGF